jgi:hypothetical protein
MRKTEEKAARATIYALCLDLLLVSDLIMENLYLFLSLFQTDMSHCILAIKDRGDLLESRAFSFDEYEVDPDRFKDIPTLQTQGVLENSDHKEAGKFRKVDHTV